MEVASQRRIIGGMFGLEVEPRNAPAPRPLADGDVLVVNGRSAIHLVVQQLVPPRVWLPSYLCGAVIDAVAAAAAPIRFYGTDDDLHPEDTGWLAEVDVGDLVVTIDYFGFGSDAESEAAATQRGAWVLRDACQTLLTGRPAGSAAVDFTVFSPRKHIGVPDGAVLRIHGDREEAAALRSTPLAPAPDAWWEMARDCCEARGRFDREGGDRSWHALFQRIEAEAPIGAYAMSDLAREVLLQRVDTRVVAERRRRNYQTLAGALADLAMRPALPADVVPLGFPIRAARRDALRQALFAEEIFPPVHWPLDARVDPAFEASHRLAREILTLPCDQRYEPGDMERMAAVVLRETSR